MRLKRKENDGDGFGLGFGGYAGLHTQGRHNIIIKAAFTPTAEKHMLPAARY